MNTKRKNNGLEELDELNFKLGLDESCNSKKKLKEIPKTVVEFDQKFNPEENAFKMSTQMVKHICNICDTFKENVECNMTFCTTGINLFAFYEHFAVCIVTHLGRDLFSEFICEHEIIACVNLSVFAKALSTLQKFNPHKLSFSNGDQDIVLKSYNDSNDQIGEITISSLHSQVEELDPTEFEYDINLRLISSDFAKRIKAMPSLFNLRMDCEKNQLLFQGKDEQSSISLHLKIDKDIVDEIEKYPEVANYNGCFMTSYLEPIVKGSKLSNFVVISFKNDSPLFVRYTISPSEDLDPHKNSTISMYFASKYDENELEDE